MSTNNSPAAATAMPNAASSSLPPTVSHAHKSYRRKYRKIMVKFEKQMRESSDLFRDQQRLYDISQRIAEQNDQILALLLELNSQPQVPSRLRYDLQDPSSAKKSEKREDEEAALEKLRSNRYKVQKGELQQPDYELTEHALLDSADFAPEQSYADLVKPGSLQKTMEESDDDESPLVGGFLSVKQEEQYLRSLDDFLDGRGTLPRAHAASAKPSDKDPNWLREAQVRNPVSVYNWLRKNQPQVFLQDPEGTKLRHMMADFKKTFRHSGAKAVKTEPEPYDDDGIALETGGSKGKRKRDDDGGYRPKGGNPRPTKKRKDESLGRRSKRASMDISAS